MMNDIEKVIENAIKKQFETTMKDTIRNEIQSTLVNSINPRFDRLEDKMDKLEDRIDKLEDRIDKLEDRMESLENTVLVIEHEHGRKLDAIFDLVNLDKEINKPKFDEISTLNKKTEKNYLHILNHEQRISTLEDLTV
ncbi:MAG: hypothetical protein J6J60_09910 [Clostridia bacterium]|nr:hypothetical protein [Clostridia bacterium]